MGTGLEVTSVTQIFVLTPVKYYGSKLGNGFTHGLSSRSVTTSAGQWFGVVMSGSHRGQSGSQLTRPPLWSGGGRSRGGCWSQGCWWSVWVSPRPPLPPSFPPPSPARSRGRGAAQVPRGRRPRAGGRVSSGWPCAPSRGSPTSARAPSRPPPPPRGRRLPRVPGPPSPALPVARAFRRRASCGLPRASCRATLLAAPVAGPPPAPGVPVRGRGGRSARAAPAARPPGALRPVGRWRPPVRASAAVGRGRAAGGGLRPPPLWRLFAARPLARSRGFGLFPFFREGLTAVPGERYWVPRGSHSPGSTGLSQHIRIAYASMGEWWLKVLPE